MRQTAAQQMGHQQIQITDLVQLVKMLRNQMIRMADAVLTESDAQQFAMEVLPGYTLTSEEPGRDSLYADENPAAFMRIETQPAEDGTYDYLVG